MSSRDTRTYADRRDYLARYQRARYARLRAEWFEGKACVRCGSTEDLNADHIDPSQKVTHNVWSWSAVRRDVELAKCQVLCLTCHKAKTLEDRGGYIPCGVTDAAYRRGCRCSPCRAANARARLATKARMAALQPTQA